MRALLPGLVDDVDLYAHYAAGWLDGGGLRVNFVASADGAAQAGGLSRGLQTRGDNAVFGVLRDLADVVLVGASTVRVEGYRAVDPSARRRAARRAHGLREELPVALLSRSLHLDPGADLFAEARPGARTIVLTCAAADPERRRELEMVADVVDCGEDAVDVSLARRALEQRGLTRILSEGGPTTFGQLVDGGVADELCLSLTPMLVGPGPTRITDGHAWADTTGLTLVGMLEEDGALFLRYRL